MPRDDFHAENRPFAVPHALECAVVQVDVGGRQGRRQCFQIDGKTMILCGDFDRLTGFVTHWMVGPTVTEFQFESRSAQGQPKQLVT